MFSLMPLDNYESTVRALSPDGVLVCAGQSAVWSHGDPRMDRFGSRAVRTVMLRLWARHVPKRRTVVCYDREESRKDIARTDVSYILSSATCPPNVICLEAISSPFLSRCSEMLQVPLHPREEGRYQSRGCFHCLPEEGPLRSQVA